VLTAQRDSLRQLAWILVAAIVAPALVFAFTAWFGYQTAFTLADRQLFRARDVAQEHAEKVFETIDRTIALMEEVVSNHSLESLRADEAKLHTRLKEIVAGLPQIKSVWIFDHTGHSIANSITSPSPQINFADRDYFAFHVDGDKSRLFVGEVLEPRPPYGGDAFFSISRRRTAPDGSFAGVIQISVLPDYFVSFYERIANEDGAYYALVRDDGAFLARYPRADRRGSLQPGRPLSSSIAAGIPRGLVTTTSSIDGRERRIGFARIPNYPIYVLAGIDVSAVQTAYLRWLGALLAFGIPATAAVIALIFLAWRRTRRMYAEASLRAEAEAALRQTQRMEALGQLTGGVAHDFNNLLMIIGGAIQQLRNQPLSDRATRSLSMIDTATKRAASLTSKLLSFARRRPLAPKIIDLGEFILDFDPALKQSLRPDIILRYEGIRPGLYANVDPDELEITLINLAVNARDAMPDGGELSVSLASDRFGSGEGPDGLEGEFVVIRFADTGVGISEENRSRIFEPFFTTKDAGKGTGLGLSQAYGFARQSSGTLSLQSTVGKGATFSLLLPRSTEAPPALHELAELNLPKVAAGERALLVEDNDDVAEVATRYLTEFGYRVERAADTNDAFKKLREGKFQLALSDIVMPGGLDGLDLARVIREYHPELPLILATGYSDKAEQSQREGFFLLPKPYSLSTLAHAINVARGQKQALKRHV